MPPVSFWWTCAEYFAGRRFGFRWACVRSCRRERRGELRQFVPSGAQNENGRLLPPVSFWWTCAEYFAGRRFGFRWACVRSCRRERRGELRQFVPSGAQNENGRLLPPVSFWWTCAEYFAGRRFGFRWACVRSCRRERRGELRQFVPSGAQNENGRLLPPVSFWWTCAEYFAGRRFGFRWACVRSCRRERRGELRQFVPSGAQNENGRLLPPVSFWWTCAESNCGLTRFLRGSYTLSRRSVSRKESSPTTFPYACFRESLCGRGSQPPQRVPH